MAVLYVMERYFMIINSWLQIATDVAAVNLLTSDLNLEIQEKEYTTTLDSNSISLSNISNLLLNIETNSVDAPSAAINLTASSVSIDATSITGNGANLSSLTINSLTSNTITTDLLQLPQQETVPHKSNFIYVIGDYTIWIGKNVSYQSVYDFLPEAVKGTNKFIWRCTTVRGTSYHVSTLQFDDRYSIVTWQPDDEASPDYQNIPLDEFLNKSTTAAELWMLTDKIKRPS